MAIEAEALPFEPPEIQPVKPEVNRYERHRVIAHIGRTFARRYDMQVIPSRQKGLWACGLDPKVNVEVSKYIQGERDTLDDLPEEAFIPKQILYDAESAQEMTMDEINTLLHHEAGHAKYTDFRLMFEGQRKAKDDGYLPTSFWLTFEGIEDPRVNTLEGSESPAIDRQIRTNQGYDLQKRITESPLTDRPYMMQFAYESFHRWLHDGEGIPELKDTEVGKLGQAAAPLLEQYFQNTDVDERRILQNQIWEIAKTLEKKDLEDEEKRQMAQKMQQGQQGGQGQGQGQGSPGQGQQGSGEQTGTNQGQGGEGAGTPHIPGGKGQQEGSQYQQVPNPKGNSEEQQSQGMKGLLDRLRQAIGGAKEKEQQSGQEEQQSEQTPKPERFDLSKLSEEEMRQVQEAVDRLSPEEKAELQRQAREALDELQKQGLEEDFRKSFKLQKNEKTGEYEVRPQLADEKSQKQAAEDYKDILEEVEAEEQAEWQRQEAERIRQQDLIRQMEAARREKLEMEKAGFDEDEREKFLLYQALEDSMYSNVRNFKQAIEKVIPRQKEPKYEGGYFSGPKFDRRDLVRRAPLNNEQFWQRQVEAPTGDPRLFIGLLVDNSGSMSGKKMEQARKTVIFFAKVCREMGIPFMGAAFGDHAEVIKQFKQNFDNPTERIKPKIIDATDASDGSTNLHEGIEVTIEEMNEQRRKLRDSHGLIFVITDGDANSGLTGDALRDYIEENRGRLTFKAFGLSGSAGERTRIQTSLNNYFGESNCAYPEGFDDLPDEAFRMLRINLMQFQKYLS